MGVRGSNVRKERRDGKSRLVIDFRYRGKDGREHRYRRDATIQTAAAARAEAERLRLQALTTGTLEPPKAAPRFADFVEGPFKTTYLPARCRPATRERYEALFTQGILEAFGEKRLDEIRAVDFRVYIAALAARGIQSRAHLGLLRTVLRAAHEFGALETLPELPKLPRASRKLPEAPPDDEVVTLLAKAGDWLRVAIALAVYAGLRQGEVRALEVRDVDFAGKRLLVRRAFSGSEVLTPKSTHERVVPLAPELAELLADAVKRKLPAALLIVNARGKTPSRQAVLTRLKTLQKVCDLPARSFHSLRHYFCTTLIRRGASVEAVRVLAGHSGLDVTQRYVHATGADLKAAIAKLSGN